MLAGSKVAVVIPAHNEGPHIEAVVRTIPGWVDLLVVVDDGSADDTVERVRRLQGPRVHLLVKRRNGGVGAAIKAGYEHAFGQSVEAAAVVAADGQMDPAELEKVLEPVISGRADYVKGDRLSHPSVRRAMPIFRFVGNHILTRLTRMATGARINDSQCGYTALSARAFERISWEGFWPRYGYPNDLISRLSTANLRIEEVVVTPIYADEESGIDAWQLLTNYPAVIAIVARRRLRSWLPKRSQSGFVTGTGIT